MTGAFLKAKFVPWQRSAAQVLGLGAGVGLWIAGTADGVPLGWQAHWAWVPFVTVAILNIRWHREAERAAAAATRPGTSPA